MPDLAKFSLSDMVECSAALRRMADGSSSMEDVAGRMVRFLYESLTDESTGRRSCALIRFFKTHPFKDLEPELQAYARARLGGHEETPDMKCLTLLGTAGDRPEWNSRKASARYKGIPLASEQFVVQFPMVAQLLTQFGLEVSCFINPDPDLLVDLEQRSYNVFYVPQALDSPYLPAQGDFVVRYGIKSALGIGGLLPSGHLFAVLLFSKVFIPRDTADKFRTLAVSAKAAVLPFDGGPVFAGPAGAVSVAGSTPPAQAEQLRSQIAAMGQLLEVHERTVRDQAVRLEQALDEAQVRARQQAAVAELGLRALEATDLAQLLNEAVVLVAEILYVPYCEVLELLPDGNALLLRAGVGFKPELVGVATVSAGTDSQAGYTLLSKEPVIVEDLRTEARFSGPPLLRELGVVSGMNVVIPGLDRPYGILGAHSNRPQTFIQDDVRFLQAVAHVLSGAIQRLRMEDALGRIAAAVSATTGETFFRSLVQCLAETLQVDYAFIGELDEERPDRVRMTAVCAHGQLGEKNRVYELAGTPCEEVVNKRLCSYASGVQALFPRDRLLVEMGVDSYLGTPLFDSAGRALGLIVVLHSRPMRNPQQAESMLQICAVRAAAELQRLRSEELLRKQSAAMEASMDGMALLDEQERYIYVNEAHARIYGSDRPRELIGQSWTILYDSQELRRFEQEVMPAMRANGYWRGEAIGRRKDGNLYPQEVSLTALANGGLIYVVRDITDRKKLEEELRQAQKMEAVGQLAGGVAHDFNNLLTAILGYCEFLRGPLDRDAFADYVAEIAKAGTRAASLTQQLLAFSRRQVLQPKVLSLNTVVADTAAMLRRLIGEHITLVTRLSPELELVKADPFQLQQVILNLAINARDAMPQGGWLTIETNNVEMDGVEARRHAGMLAGSYVRLAVSDTGHGMDRETMSHIFEPFFTTKEMGKGTGLGLATVYGIVKQSEGFIEAQSQPERGATFSIYLPRLCQPVEAAADKPMPVAAVRGQETILVVEDADLVRSLTCRILQTRGYTVLEARDGIEAIEVWRTHRDKVHLLLTDAIMPFMSGRELAERLSAERPAVRILYMSGYTDDAGLHEGASHEGTAFLQKPFAPEVLLEKVRAVLDAP